MARGEPFSANFAWIVGSPVERPSVRSSSFKKSPKRHRNTNSKGYQAFPYKGTDPAEEPYRDWHGEHGRDHILILTQGA